MTYTAMNGIYTALVTPFRDDESIDFDAVGQLVDDQVSAGIAGLVVGGSTGEFAAMSLQEREELTDHVSEVASGRAEIVVGLGSVRTADSVRLAEHALSVGAQSGLLVMPYYEPLSEAELSAFVSNVAAVGLPIMIYNNPGGTGEMLSPRFLADLSHIPNVVGVKDTTPEPNRLFAIDSLAAGRLDVLSGHDTSTIFAFLSGRKAAIWGAPNVHPQACVALWRLAVADRDADGALALWNSFYHLNAFLESHSYVATAKAGAELRGVAVGHPRLPIAPLPDGDREALRSLIADVDATLESLGHAPSYVGSPA